MPTIVEQIKDVLKATDRAYTRTDPTNPPKVEVHFHVNLDITDTPDEEKE